MKSTRIEGAGPQSMMLYQSEKDRYHSLDALRGLAALCVVCMHFHDLLFGRERRSHFSHWQLGLLYLASPFRSGASAVALFFVLSGFVLALTLLNGRRFSYFPFAIRRICRIYLPYLAGLALAILGAARFHGQLPKGMWQTLPWPVAPTFDTVLEHVLFLGSYNILLFNFVFWTLVIEMRVSLVYPFMVQGLQRLRSRTVASLNLLLLLLLTAAAFRFPDADFLKTFRFACFFVVGLLLARNRKQIQAWYERLSPIWRRILMAISLLGFGYNIALRAPGPLLDLICLASSAGILVATLHQASWRNWLQRPAPQFLGQISYSLYLVHFPLLLVEYMLIGRRISSLAFLPLYLSSAIAGAALFYVCVEKPCLLLSRRMSTTSGRGAVRASTTG